jgi:hypothetical protein
MKRLHTRVGGVRRCGFRALREGVILLAVASGTALFCSASASTVSGNIQTPAGKPIRAAITLHDLSTSRVVGQTPFDHQFASKGDGSFSLASVPAGKYEICVEAPQENVVDPCVWSLLPQTVTVSGSAPVTGVAVQVQTGYRLQIRSTTPSLCFLRRAAASRGTRCP